jgi:hypothetical protein
MARPHRVSRHRKARKAKAALSGITGDESIQEGLKIIPFRQSLNRHHLAAPHLQGQEMTRDHRLLVHQNGTGATLATIAGPFRTGKIEMIPQHFKQGGARFQGQSM